MYIIIISLLLITTFPNHLIGMKRAPSTIIEKTQCPTKKTKPEIIPPTLPFELQIKIFLDFSSYGLTKHNAYETCRHVTNIAHITRALSIYVNAPKNIRDIINGIADDHTDHYSIANKIDIRGAKNYIHQNNRLSLQLISNSPPYPNLLKEMITAGADINYKNNLGKPFLHRASERSCLHTKTLLDFGANPNVTYQEKTVLERAIKNKNLEMIKLLLAHKPHNKCLHAAIDTQDTEIIGLILQQKDIPIDQLKYAIRTCNERNDEIELLQLKNFLLLYVNLQHI
jgi:hypothetical protein